MDYNTVKSILAPSNCTLFFAKNLRWASFQRPTASKKSWPEFLSLGRKKKNVWIFFYCHNTFFPSCFFNIFSRERVQKLKFSKLCIQKLSSHQLLMHSSLIIYWCSPSMSFVYFYFWIYFEHVFIIAVVVLLCTNILIHSENCYQSHMLFVELIGNHVK